MDNPNEHYFLIEQVAICYNPLQEGEFIACQTYPPPKKAWDGSCLQIASVVYRGFDYAAARKAAELEDLGRDCSSAGVCKVVDGQIMKVALDGHPYKILEDPTYYDDDDDKDFDDSEGYADEYYDVNED